MAPAPPRRRVRWRPARLGLRSRVTVAFGLLALGLSVVLSVIAWTLVSQSLVRDTQGAALAQTSVDAAQLDATLASSGSSAASSLADLPRDEAAAALSLVNDRWYASSPRLGPDVLPGTLVTAVEDRHAATQRVDVDGRLYLAVGVPLTAPSTAFFQLYSMTATQNAARSLAVGLAAATVVTALLGLVLGRSAARIALHPLTRLNAAAAAVAAGRRGVRLDDGGDPDLVPVTKSFNQTVADLDRRVVADARFAVDVSHELRTPLTTMLNSMQVISNREDSLPPNLREPVELLAGDLDRFRRLVTDLLEVSRHDAGDQLVLDTVTVGELVRKAADGAARRPVTTVAADVGTVALQADKRRLERVVVNLVSNAESHGGGCVGVHVTRAGDAVRVCVEDAGPGIPPAMQGRIFERFARGPTQASVGVGLGLAIVQRHVELHGGSVTAESRPEGGARLVVELPFERH